MGLAAKEARKDILNIGTGIMAPKYPIRSNVAKRIREETPAEVCKIAKIKK
jgi:hypothetical protein